MTISAAFTSIHDTAHQYYQSIPKGTLKAMGKSFIASYALHSLIKESLKAGLSYGCFAALISAVHSAAGPLLQKIFKTKGTLVTAFARAVIALSASSSIMVGAGYSINLSVLKIYALWFGVCWPIVFSEARELNRPAIFLI